MNPPPDIEALMSRLHKAASTLDPQEPPLAPPIGEWHRTLLALRDRRDPPSQLPDSLRPTLAELLRCDCDADSFLEQAYERLFGRPIDAEGLAFYREEVSVKGRLHVLSCLVQAEECQHYRKQQGATWPVAVHRLTRAHRLIERLGPLRGLGDRFLQQVLRLITRRYRQRWALQAALYELLRRQPEWGSQRHALAEALLEMDERQRHFGSRQDHEYARQQALWQQLAMAWSSIDEGNHESPVPSPPGQVEGTDSRVYRLAYRQALRPGRAEPGGCLDVYREVFSLARQVGMRALDLAATDSERMLRLVQEGFQVKGGDEDLDRVLTCQRQGQDIVHASPLMLLREQANDSQGLVMAFGIIEQLPLDETLAVVSEAYRVLLPGGLLVLHSSVETADHDIEGPRHPVDRASLEFLLQFHGFSPLPDGVAGLPEPAEGEQQARGATRQMMGVAGQKPHIQRSVS